MPIRQYPITSDDLNVLAVICAQLDDQPYKASYFPFARPYVCGPEYLELRRGVLFWSSGHGWRLHTDWRRALEAKRAAMGDVAGVE